MTEQTHFGFETVSGHEKTSRVKDVFRRVAKNYDLMNDLMSGGLHRLWKNHLVGMMKPKAGQIILDVAGGTGDVACALLTTSRRRSAVVHQLWRIGVKNRNRY